LLGKAWYATGPQYGSLCQRATVGFSALLEGPAGDFPVPWITIDQPCTVVYTSGTTGHPKGAVLTHRSILMNTAMTATLHVRTAADTVVSALPCSHVYGNIVMNGAIAYGMTLVLHKVFDAERVLQSIPPSPWWPWAACRVRLAAYKVPRLFQIVDDLPKTSTGKILRRMLRTMDT